MLYLDKLLAQLAYPLGLALTLSLLALGLFAGGRRRGGGILLLAAVGWLWLWSLPIVADTVRHALEGQFPNAPIATLPTADVIVVLGGGITAGPPDGLYPDLGAAADRVWHAARLYHAGKAPRLLLSGGRMAWRGERLSEAAATRRFLLDLGVPTAALLFEDRSRSTRENARYSAELIQTHGFARVLLVTSALHMPRALATFRAAGIDAVPAPTDFEVLPEPPHLLRWLPDAQALADSTRALKEYLGLWVYRWRGWAV